ncbi:MAG: hypothetical protein KIT33_01760 [Candidatus Kapabacteria bacterium]|nr:hypothetical protein [Ignavibacteriota bacterium]MCW5883677.1 hypothetical protein [Candidatus Kapabacteria bacterium]
MNTKIILSLALLLLFLTSCEDIVNSEKNIKKTGYLYNKVLNNQEKNVLMPLKVGNMWLYEVKQFDSSGTMINEYIDSIEVLEKINFRGETWFRVRMIDMGSTWNSILTNTDKGLYRADENTTLDCRFIVAQYPENRSQIIALHEENVMIMYFDGQKDVIDTVTTQYLIELNANYTASFKSANYPAREYSTYWRALELVDSKTLHKVDVFVPNIGLFEHKRYRFAGGRRYVETHYKLVATNLIK